MKTLSSTLRRYLFVAVLAGLLSPVVVRAGGGPGLCVGLFAPEKASVTQYYISKLSEIKDVDRTAPLAMTLRMLINSTTKSVEVIKVPVSSLLMIHPINHEAALEVLKTRIGYLSQIGATDGTLLTAEVLDRFVPSKNPIRVIATGSDQYVAFDGNGRLLAIKEAFAGKNVFVEVEIYRTDSIAVQYLIRAIRSMRGMP